MGGLTNSTQLCCIIGVRLHIINPPAAPRGAPHGCPSSWAVPPPPHPGCACAPPQSEPCLRRERPRLCSFQSLARHGVAIGGGLWLGHLSLTPISKQARLRRRGDTVTGRALLNSLEDPKRGVTQEWQQVVHSKLKISVLVLHTSTLGSNVFTSSVSSLARRPACGPMQPQATERVQ